MSRPGTGPRIIKRKNKLNYYIRYIDAIGIQRERSTNTPVRNEAQEVLEEFLRVQRIANSGQAVPPSKMTVIQVLEDYVHYVKDDKEADRLSYAIEPLLNHWQDKTIDHVNKETVKTFAKASAKAPGTIHRDLTCLRSAINHAIAMNRVLPIAKFKIPRGGKPKDRWLNRNELARLLHAAGQEFRSKFSLRIFILIAVYTGARSGAIMELEWSQINFEKNTIDFNKPDEAESNKRRSCIPIPRKLRHFLLRRYEFAKNKSSYVFHQRKDPYKRLKSIVKGFRAACKRAGLKEVTPHTLRHTCVSLLVQKGEKISDVAAFMNMSFPTLERVYAHHNDQHIRDMADRM